MPSHRICHELGMRRDRFLFLWRYFHCQVKDGSASEESSVTSEDSNDLDDDDDDDLMEITMERIQRNQEEELESKSEEEEEDEVSKESKKVVWFEKLKFLITHVREISYLLVFILGTVLSLDEMMIRFKGRSNETHRIKNKPIKEGYKFFVLCTSLGYVLNFTPDGRTANKTKQQEYLAEASVGKIESMILHLVEVVDRFRDRQQKRLGKYKRVLRSRKGEDDFDEKPMAHFCLAMDNYFTLPKIIQRLRECGIGVVGTARFKRGWPPALLRNVEQNNCAFNDFNWMVDEHGTLVARWMDNGLVFCVSTLHKVGKIVKRNRKRPRKTCKNSGHVDKVWGDDAVKEIFIPTLIDDYNHWMGGVDLCDQRISYYHCNFRCHRNWIPMFLQILSIVRNNAFIVYKELVKGKPMSHKKFTLEMIECLMKKAHTGKDQDTPRLTPARQLQFPKPSPKSSPKSPPKAKQIKRGKMKEDTTLEALLEKYPCRLAQPREAHARVQLDYEKPGVCVVCSVNYLQKKEAGEKVNYQKYVKRTGKVCGWCNKILAQKSAVFLCKDHFDVFHDAE